jgi:hypothetical protein
MPNVPATETEAAVDDMIARECNNCILHGGACRTCQDVYRWVVDRVLSARWNFRLVGVGRALREVLSCDDYVRLNFGHQRC